MKSEKKKRVLWQNKIIGHDEVPPESLLANPYNFRLHSMAQQEALEDAIEEVGFIRSVSVNKRTGCIIDGHLRVILALRRNEKSIPVEWLDLTDEQERLALATLDPLGALARTDRDKYAELISTTQPEGEAIRDVMRELAEKAGVEAAFGDTIEAEDSKASKTFEGMPDELDGIASLKEYALFQSSLPMGFPELHAGRIMSVPENWDVWGGPAFQYKDPDVFLYLWGRSDSIRGLDTSRTVIGFYVDEFRFESFWDNPSRQTAKLINGNVRGAIMPHYGMYPEFPQVVRLFQRYKSLWLGRYFQEAGLDILPDLQLSIQDEDYYLLGMPQGAPFAVRFDANDNDLKDKIVMLEHAIDKLNPDKVLVYTTDELWVNVETSIHSSRMVHCRVRGQRFGRASSVRKLGKDVKQEDEM